MNLVSLKERRSRSQFILRTGSAQTRARLCSSKLPRSILHPRDRQYKGNKANSKPLSFQARYLLIPVRTGSESGCHTYPSVARLVECQDKTFPWKRVCSYIAACEPQSSSSSLHDSFWPNEVNSKIKRIFFFF